MLVEDFRILLVFFGMILSRREGEQMPMSLPGGEAGGKISVASEPSDQLGIDEFVDLPISFFGWRAPAAVAGTRRPLRCVEHRVMAPSTRPKCAGGTLPR